MPQSSCSKCGTYVSVVENFCPSCGTSVNAPQPRPVQQVEPTVQFPNLVPCPDCGNKCSRAAKFCPSCGRQFIQQAPPASQEMATQYLQPPPFVQPPAYQPPPVTYYPVAAPPYYVQPPKSRAAYIVLGLFLGCLGIHNFYAGHNGRGIAQLLITVFLGCWGIGFLITGLWALIEIVAVTEDGNGVRMV
jgi:TM2 domain-containing membrane protein YozV